jgi:hypothetical protein
VLFIGYIVASLKHHVLKKVRKSRFADFLAGRAYMVSNVHVHHRVRVIFVNQDREAIAEHITLVRNYKFVGLTFFNLFYKPGLSLNP